MTTYQYRNQAGEVRTIHGSMQNPPPELVMIFENHHWLPVDAVIEGKELVEELLRVKPENRVWRRDYGAGLGTHVPDLAVRSPDGRLPVSHSAPRIRGGKLDKIGDQVVRIHDDGIITNAVGQPVVDSNSNARRVAKATGMEID